MDWGGDSITLLEARQWLRKRVNEGTDCPCCKRFAKVYKLKINTNMARFLISVARKKTEWVHYNECDYVGRDYPWIRLWGLAETSKSEETKKNMSGLWRITNKGRLFIHNEITVPLHVYAYDGEVIRASEEQVSVVESLGDKFNYQELMDGIVPPSVTTELFD